MPSESEDKKSPQELMHLSDLELIRIADTDDDAFVILASERLPHIRLMLKEWCEANSAVDAYYEIAETTIYTAVDYARHLKPDVLKFEPSDWFQQVAMIVFFTWVERYREGYPTPLAPSPPVTLTPEEQRRRKEEGILVRKHFSNLKMADHRQILELVMIEGLSPEAAGREMGLRSDIVTQIIFRAALEDLLVLIKSDTTHETKPMFLDDANRVRRCLKKIKGERERDFLTLVFNHSLDIYQAAEQTKVGEEYAEQFLLESLRDLYALLMNDWRDSWRRPGNRSSDNT